MQFGNLFQDPLYEILRNTRYEDIFSLCRSDKRFEQLCRSQRGVELIKQLKQNYQVNLIDQILNKLKPVYFSNAFNKLNLSNDKIIEYRKDYDKILFPKILNILNDNKDIVDYLINRYFPTFNINNFEDFLTLHERYHGKLMITEIIFPIYQFKYAQYNTILDTTVKHAIKIFLLKHPELITPFLNYYNNY